MTAIGQVHLHHVPRLEKLMDSDDIEHFLVASEYIAVACQWSKPDWVFHLMPLLTGNVRSTYLHMDMDDKSYI